MFESLIEIDSFYIHRQGTMLTITHVVLWLFEHKLAVFSYIIHNYFVFEMGFFLQAIFFLWHNYRFLGLFDFLSDYLQYAPRFQA